MRPNLALMQIRLCFQREPQRLCNDACRLVRAQVGTGHDEFRTKQSFDSPGGLARLSVAEFRERQIMR
jgi:hypothetical protein